MTRPAASSLLAAALLLLAPRLLALPPAWEPRGPGGGGALFSPSLSPHVRDEMFVACDMTELFHTRDFGRSWSQADFRVIQGNRASQVWFTEDRNVVYTIDHSTRNLVDLRQPVRSADGGSTWSPLTGDPTGADAFAMAVDPARGDRVFVVDYSNLYFSSDAGVTFRQVYSDATGNGCHVAGIFTDGNLIFLGLNAGLLVSTDGGASFALNPGLTGIDFGPGGEAMTGFAGAKTGAQVRLLCVTHARDAVYLGMLASDHAAYRSVYMLDWGAGDWMPRVTGISAGAHPFFAGMSRDDIDVAWVAGGSDAGTPVVFRTPDGGRAWSEVFLTTDNQNIATGWQGQGGDRGWGYAECALGFGVSPVDSSRAAITDFGYVHVTDDGGVSWRQAYVDPASENPAGSPTPPRRPYRTASLENTSAWWLHWATPATMIGCHSDIRGARSEDGGATWGFDYAGHADNTMYHVVERPSDGRLFAATGSVHDIYQSTRLGDALLDAGTGRVLFSSDDGSTWQLLHDFGDVVTWLALDPSDENTLLAAVVNNAAGTGGIWRTRDAQDGAASTWTQLAAPPRTQGHPFNIHVLRDGTLVATYSGRRDGGGAFTASSGVFVSTDGGASWLDRSDAGMRYWTKDLVVDPHDSSQSTWYVGVFSGWGGPPNGLGGLHRTFDRGQSWTRLIDVDRVESLTIDPADPQRAFMTSEVDGLWVTTNLGDVAPVFSQVAEYPFRQPERVFFNPVDPGEIWVTSFGNGLRVGREVVTVRQDLLRGTLSSLTPVTPAISSVLPLDPVADAVVTGCATGVLDPDPTIVGDPSRPLAFYSVVSSDGTPVSIRVTLTPADRVRIDY